MTVLLNMAIGAAAGLSLAAAAKEPLKTALYPSRTPYFGVTAIYAGAALVPSGLMLYLLYPDWSLMYVANPSQISQLLLIPAVILGCFGAPVLGFFVAQRLIVAHRASAIQRAQLAVLVLGLLILLAGRRAWGNVGFYEAYHYGGAMVPLARSPVVVALAIVLPVLAIVFAFSRRAIQQHIRALAHVDEDGPVAGGEAKG